jgi:5-methylthioadenosine/S-adenosylhomocysteine deaminase
MSTLLIKNIVLNGERKEILISGNKIEKIGETIDCDVERVIDGKGKFVIPGFVNMHTHAAMTIMRGIGEDLSLMEWLQNKIWPTESKLTDEMVYWGTKLACLEMIKTGTTCFNDQYWFLPEAVRATDEMGMRSLQSFVILDLMDESRSEKIIEDCYKSYDLSREWSDRNRFAIGVHSPYSVSGKMIRWAGEFAKERDLLVHLHLSETHQENEDCIKKMGFTPTRYLDYLGILDSNVLAAHCLWIDEDDIPVLAERGVTVIHNINSNLKIASGYKFKYNEFRDAGIRITLGTDGCASSNNLDMLEAMKTSALVQKGWRGDPTAMPLNELIELATSNGAEALGIKSGRVKEGYLADISLVDVSNYSFTPNINFLANLIYSSNSSCIDTVICDGKVLMENRVVEGEQEILSMVNRLYKKLL